MKWRFKKNELDDLSINKIEQKLDVKLPDDFYQLIKEFNGARPSLGTYDLEDEKEKTFDSLIDYDYKSDYNVERIYNTIKNLTINKIIPFGDDGFGNYICFDYSSAQNPKIVLLDHETNKIDFIANSFNEFLMKLY